MNRFQDFINGAVILAMLFFSVFMGMFLAKMFHSASYFFIPICIGIVIVICTVIGAVFRDLSTKD